MAELYLAGASGPSGFKRTLVIKKLLPDLASDRDFVEMFLGEARIAGELNHPNIVHVYEVGEADGAYFIAMEYVDGPNLRTIEDAARRTGKPLSPYLSAKIVSYACDGLGYAHELRDLETRQSLRIVHRDVSPENIVIARNGSLKVVDFGIAKAAWQHQRTQTGVVKGKMGYMAPEQMAQGQVDHRADIYSLGVVLYELLSGARPYDAEDDLALAQAVLRGMPPVPLSRRRPDLPGRLMAIVDKALAREPDARYQSCRALQSDLDRFIHGAGQLVGPQDLANLVADLQAEPSWGKVAVVTPAADGTPITAMSRPRPAPAATQPRAQPRRRPFPAAAGIALAVLVAAAAFSLTFVVRKLGSGEPAPTAAVQPPARPTQPAPAPPAPAPSTTPAGEVAAAPPPSEPVQPGTVRVETRPPVTVRIGERTGRSPLTAEVEPGEVKIRLMDQKEGLDQVEVLRVEPGMRRELRYFRIVFRSVPEAKIQVNDRPYRNKGPDGQQTPIIAYLEEGKHSVRFDCSTGKVDRQSLTVPSVEQLDGRCARR